MNLLHAQALHAHRARVHLARQAAHRASQVHVLRVSVHLHLRAAQVRVLRASAQVVALLFRVLHLAQARSARLALRLLAPAAHRASVHLVLLVAHRALVHLVRVAAVRLFQVRQALHGVYFLAIRSITPTLTKQTRIAIYRQHRPR